MIITGKACCTEPKTYPSPPGCCRRVPFGYSAICSVVKFNLNGIAKVQFNWLFINYVRLNGVIRYSGVENGVISYFANQTAINFYPVFRFPFNFPAWYLKQILLYHQCPDKYVVRLPRHPGLKSAKYLFLLVCQYWHL